MSVTGTASPLLGDAELDAYGPLPGPAPRTEDELAALADPGAPPSRIRPPATASTPSPATA